MFFLNTFQWRGFDSSGQALVKYTRAYAFVYIYLSVLQIPVLVLSHGTSPLWEAEEAADGVGESEDGPGECVTNWTESCNSRSQYAETSF